MTQQIGGAIGLAIATAVATSQTHGAVADPSSVTSGFRSALLVSAAIAASVVSLPGTARRTTGRVATAPAH